MEKPTCPYMNSGLCYRNGCIYLPSMDCMAVNEFRNRLKYVKKKKRMVKRYER